jgi:hypothetical protein
MKQLKINDDDVGLPGCDTTGIYLQITMASKPRTMKSFSPQ